MRTALVDLSGSSREIGWYITEDKKALLFGCRFSVETEIEKFLLIDERKPLDWSRGYILLGQALEHIKKGEVTSPFEDQGLKLENDAVQVYLCEKSAFILYWDGAERKFNRFWTAD